MAIITVKAICEGNSRSAIAKYATMMAVSYPAHPMSTRRGVYLASHQIAAELSNISTYRPSKYTTRRDSRLCKPNDFSGPEWSCNPSRESSIEDYRPK